MKCLRWYVKCGVSLSLTSFLTSVCVCVCERVLWWSDLIVYEYGTVVDTVHPLCKWVLCWISGCILTLATRLPASRAQLTNCENDCLFLAYQSGWYEEVQNCRVSSQVSSNSVGNTSSCCKSQWCTRTRWFLADMIFSQKSSFALLWLRLGLELGSVLMYRDRFGTSTRWFLANMIFSQKSSFAVLWLRLGLGLGLELGSVLMYGVRFGVCVSR